MAKPEFKVTVRDKRVWSGNDIAVASRKFYDHCAGRDWKDSGNLVRLMRFRPIIDDYESFAWGDAI